MKITRAVYLAQQKSSISLTATNTPAKNALAATKIPISNAIKALQLKLPAMRL
ncbi:MAG: hypothetical protein ACJ70Z_07475 [Nitrososphaera sp.]